MVVAGAIRKERNKERKSGFSFPHVAGLLSVLSVGCGAVTT